MAAVRTLREGLWEGATWSLRGVLVGGAFAAFAVTIGYVAIGAGSRNGTAGGLGGSIVLLIPGGAMAGQAARRPGAGAPRREEWWDQLLSWPRWKQITVLTVAVAFAVTMLILGLLSAS